MTAAVAPQLASPRRLRWSDAGRRFVATRDELDEVFGVRHACAHPDVARSSNSLCSIRPSDCADRRNDISEGLPFGRVNPASCEVPG